MSRFVLGSISKSCRRKLPNPIINTRFRKNEENRVGRIEEKKLLKSLLKEDESQFVAVFGRRRVRKTFLVRENF